VWADAPKEAEAGGWEKHTLVVGGKSPTPFPS
jgi:hypothetical protein